MSRAGNDMNPFIISHDQDERSGIEPANGECRKSVIPSSPVDRGNDECRLQLI